MDFGVGKILGQLGDGQWGQVHDFTATGEAFSKRGRLVAAVSLTHTQNQGMEMVTAGREVLARLHELYFGQTETDPLTALRQAALTLTQEFSPIEIVSIAAVGKALYVVVVGQGGVWVKRGGGSEGWVVNPQRTSADLTAVSGWLQPETVVVGGTSQFWQGLTLGAIRAAVTNNTLASEVAESLVTVVHGNDSAMGAAGLILLVPALPAPATAVSPTVAARPSLSSVSNLKAKLTSWIPKPTGPIFVSHGDKTPGRKRTMWLGIGFLGLLLLLVGGWQWRRSYLSQRSSERSQQISEVVHKFNEAQALTELNPIRSRQLLEEVTAEIAALKSQKISDEQLVSIEANIGQVLGAASGVKTTASQVIMDLEWLRPGMQGSRLAWQDGKLVVLDTAADRLVVVDPSKKSGQIVAGKEAIGDTALLATYPNKITLTSDKGLVECSFSGSCKTVVSTNPGGVDMGMFAGNIYVLTTSGISRYQVTDSGYSQAQSWLAEEEDTQVFSRANSMAIDAFIWLTTNDSQVLKYARGVKENFALTELDKPLAASPIIYTAEEADHVYLLDKLNSRVVVVDKTGAYQAQYPSQQAREASDIVVDEKENKMYLLTGSKIWQFDL